MSQNGCEALIEEIINRLIIRCICHEKAVSGFNVIAAEIIMFKLLAKTEYNALGAPMVRITCGGSNLGILELVDNQLMIVYETDITLPLANQSTMSRIQIPATTHIKLRDILDRAIGNQVRIDNIGKKMGDFTEHMEHKLEKILFQLT